MQSKHILLVTLLVLGAATAVLGSKSMLRRQFFGPGGGMGRMGGGMGRMGGGMGLMGGGSQWGGGSSQWGGGSSRWGGGRSMF